MNTKPDGKKIKIAILGSRGIPPEFGGFETFAEELSTRLVQKGFDLTVFCETSQSYKASAYKGIKLKYIKGPKVVGLRSLWFDTLSVIKSRKRYDIIYMLGYMASFSFFLPRLYGTKVWINMDGLEWKRSKWSILPKLYIRFAEYFAAKLATLIIADAKEISDYLINKFNVADRIITIPYGAYLVEKPPSDSFLKKYDIEKEKYYIVVCRLEPENHVLEIIKGFIKSNSDKQLIILGDLSVQTKYLELLKEIANHAVSFIGTVFNREELESLRYHSFCYFHGHSVGGTNPSLLEAMGCGNFIIAHDNPFNREVTDNACWYFKKEEDIRNHVDQLEKQGKSVQICENLKTLIKKQYRWDDIAADYEKLILGKHGVKYGK